MHARKISLMLGGLSCMLLLSGCSFKATFKETTDTTSNITGTTSGRVWWNEDGLLKPEHKVSAFTAYNAQNLEEDLARGQGEYLASLGTLMALCRGLFLSAVRAGRLQPMESLGKFDQRAHEPCAHTALTAGPSACTHT